jgi:hypothetical protein
VDHLVSSSYFVGWKKADRQDPSILHIRSSMFYRVIIRFIRPQTAYHWGDCLSRSRILHAQLVYRVLPILPGSCVFDSMGK